jgi:F0F1-type ATP synthase assembly protein I
VPSPEDKLQLLVRRLLWLQAGVGVAAALVARAFWGRNDAISVLAGALIGVIANLYMTLQGLRPASTARSALGRLYFGQFVKMVVSVVLLYVAARELPLVVKEPVQLVVPPLLIGFVATLVVVWFIPFASAARMRRREGDTGSGTD